MADLAGCDVAVPVVLDKAAARLETASLALLKASAVARKEGAGAGYLVVAASHVLGMAGQLRIAFDLEVTRLEDPAADPTDFGPLRGTLEAMLTRADQALGVLGDAVRIDVSEAVAEADGAVQDVRTILGALLDATFGEDNAS